MGEKVKAPGVLPVLRTKEQAKQTYDRISNYYDYLTGSFERKFAEMALKRLSIVKGETVLEIGFGTGHCLRHIAESVGQTGKVYGIDISTGMQKMTKRRLEKAELINRVDLYCGDAVHLPHEDSIEDVVFMSFVLELFDTPEISKVLEEVKRVLKPKGRLGVTSMSKENGQSILLRCYEWLHKKLPKYIDCRPIFLERSIKDAEFNVIFKDKVKLFSLPVEIVIAAKW